MTMKELEIEQKRAIADAYEWQIKHEKTPKEKLQKLEWAEWQKKWTAYMKATV